MFKYLLIALCHCEWSVAISYEKVEEKEEGKGA